MGASACIVGCGGLGGYVINALARSGVSRLTLIDGDSFSKSNLNRQLYANSETLGKNKAQVSVEAVRLIDPEIQVTAHPVMLTEENAAELLSGHGVVIDCLDNVPTRRLLASVCKVPLVHGAISGQYGQAAVLMPGDGLFDTLYPSDETVMLGNPVSTVQLVGSIQSAEAIKILEGKKSQLQGRVLFIDLGSYDFELVSIGAK